jgi:putative ABC transport system permease protein
MAPPLLVGESVAKRRLGTENALLITLALRNVFRNRGRFLLTTFVVTVASMLLVYATGQIAGVEATLVKGMTDTLTGHLQIKPKAAPKDFFEFSSARRLELVKGDDLERILTALRSLDAVEAAAPRIRFGSLIGNDDRSVPALVMAVDPAQEPRVTPDLGTLLPPLGDPRSALVSRYLSEKLALGVGAEILAFTDTPNNSFNARPYRVAGLAEAPVLIDEFMNALFVVDLTSARQLLYLPGGATEIALRVKPGYERQLDRVVAQVESLLTASQREYLAVYPYTEVAKSVGNIAGIAAGIGAIQVGTVMLVMLVIVLIITKMSLHERRAEIGTLISIGMVRARLAALFLSEVLIRILIGYGAGCALAVALLAGVRAAGGVRARTAVDQYLYGGKVMLPVIDVERVVLGFLLVLTAAVLTTLASCWKAGGQDAVALLSSKK